MSSGGGSSQTTEIKSKPSLLVQDWYSPEFLNKLAQTANQYQERAFSARAANEDLTNRIRASYGKAPLYDSLVRSDTGETVSGNVVTPIDATQLIPGPEMFKAPGARQEENRLRKELKETKEQLSSREVYKQALGSSRLPRMTGGG